MAEYLIQSETLTEIAEAIRAKIGGTELISVSEMGSKIDEIVIPIAEEITLQVNFSDGNMIVEPSENTLLSKVTVQKPNTLVPENIAKDVEIAGVVGVLEGATGGEFDNTLGHFLINFDKKTDTIVLHRVLYDYVYKDTGNYDVEVPREVNGMIVEINSEGV